MSSSDLELRVGKMERRLQRIEDRLGINTAIEPSEPSEVEPHSLAPSSIDLTSAHVFPAHQTKTDGLAAATPEPPRISPAASPVVHSAPPTSSSLPSPVRHPSTPPPIPASALADAAHAPAHAPTPHAIPPTPPPTDSLAWLRSQWQSNSSNDQRSDSAKPADSWQLESLIGGRWYAIAGALAVVVGVGLFLKLGIDRGWFAMPPEFKCILAALFGAGLMGAGEFLRRRINASASTGAYSAGLGIIYATTLAANHLYGLIPDSITFLLLAATALIGIATSVAVQLPAVGAIGLIGGYLAPFLFSDSQPNTIVLPAYLIMLLVIGLALPLMRGAAFAPHRTIVRFATLVLGGVWALAQSSTRPDLALIFTIIVWVLYHTELCISALRAQLVPSPSQPFAFGQPLTRQEWRRWSPLAATFSVTAWATAIAFLMMQRLLPGHDWVAPAGYFFATSVLGLIFAGHLDWFRQRPENDREYLGAVFHLQAAALLIIVVTLFFSDWAQVVAWMAMSLAAILAGNLLRSRVFHYYGIVALGICTARLLAIDSQSAALTASAVTAFDFNFSRWTLLVTLAGITWCLDAFALLRISRDPSSTAQSRALLPDAAAIVGLIFASIAMIDAAPGSSSRSAVVLGASALAWAWSARFSRTRLAAFGDLALFAAALFAIDTQWWQSPNTAPFAGLALSPDMLMPALVGIVLVLRAIWRQASRPIIAHAQLLLALAALTAAPFHRDASSSSLTVYWCLLSIALSFVHRPGWLLRTDVAALLVLAFATVYWVSHQVLGIWSYAGFATGILLAAIIVIIPRFFSWVWQRPVHPWFRATIASIAAAIFFTASSLQVAATAAQIAQDSTVRAAAVSVWWGIFAIGLILMGFFRRLAILRHAGLLLLAVGAVKGLVIDQWDAPSVWRISSFILLGIMMMGVAAGYQKVMKVQREKGASPGETPASTH